MASKILNIELKDVPLFRGLTSSERALVETALRVKPFEKGEFLFTEGSSCERIFIVKSGRVKVFRTASSGREQILEILEPGQTCACNPGSSSWACVTNSQAMTACEVWFLPRDNYIKLVNSNSSMMHALNKLFADRLCHFSSLIADVSLNEVKKRLIKFLLDMSDEDQESSKKDEVLSINFTREEIAQRIGTARETIVRHLYQLKESKLIDIKPRQIIIRNREGLHKLLR
ncbi:MAG: Crp/Fnr family transcriptional regulator [Candidatus Omnitrophota bacterium]